MKNEKAFNKRTKLNATQSIKELPTAVKEEKAAARIDNDISQ
jgi:hypothetical protein